MNVFVVVVIFLCWKIERKMRSNDMKIMIRTNSPEIHLIDFFGTNDFSIATTSDFCSETTVVSADEVENGNALSHDHLIRIHCEMRVHLHHIQLKFFVVFERFSVGFEFAMFSCVQIETRSFVAKSVVISIPLQIPDTLVFHERSKSLFYAPMLIPGEKREMNKYP